MSSGDRLDVQAPIDNSLYNSIKAALTPQRPRILIVGGIPKMYDEELREREDVCLFRSYEDGQALRNFSIPKSAGCVVMARVSGHANTKKVKRKCPDGVTLIPGAYDTNVINRVLKRILAEQPLPTISQTAVEEQIMPVPKPQVPPSPEPVKKPDHDPDATVLLAIYVDMPTQPEPAWISDKKTGKAIRGVCGEKADTRTIVANCLKKGWLIPGKRSDATRVGSYGATEAGVTFLKEKGEVVPELCYPAPPSLEVAPTRSSVLGTRIDELERDIAAAAGLDEELKVAEGKVEELKARIENRNKDKERLKQIKALLE